MASSEVIVGAFTLGGTLSGVLMGFAGQYVLERRRDDRASRTAVSTVFFEMSLLGESLRTAALEEKRTRREIRALSWERYGAELINHLPQPFVSVLNLQYDQLDRVSLQYDMLASGVDDNQWQSTSLLLLGWAYRSDRLRELQNEWRRRMKRPWNRRTLAESESATALWNRVESTRDLGEQIEIIRHDVQDYALRHLRHEGYDVDDEGKLRSGKAKANNQEVKHT